MENGYSNRNEEGATAIFVAVVMLAMIGMASFAIDIGFIAVTKSELQNAADAAALAAVRRLGKFYEDGVALDLDEVRSAAKGVVGTGKNTVGGKTISILDEDIEINIWNGYRFIDSQTPSQPDAVRVTVRRDSQNNGPINTFFARIFGVDEIEMTAVAIGALTNTDLPDTSSLEWVGVSSEHFDSSDPNMDFAAYYCGDEIDFTNCVAQIQSGQDLSSVQIGTSLDFSSRVDDSASAFQSTGMISVVVFDHTEDTGLCGEERLTVIGFAEIDVDDTDLDGNADSRKWQCSFYPDRGSGKDFPVKGSIPALVR